MLPSQLQSPEAPNSAREALRARALYVLPLAIAVAAVLTGCGGGDKAAAGPGGGGMPPPAPVGVVKTELQAVGLQTELPGRVEAQRTAQVRARVNGVVLKRLFTEGSEVKAGQVLFQIDPAPYQAALDSAQASLAKAQANLAQAAAQAERNKPLVEARAISQQEYLSSVAAAKAAEADVAAGKAAVQSAKLNLGYAAVTAPISGRIGRALVTEGALVSAAEATQLALIQQTGSVYVNFTQSANEVQQLRRALAGGKLRAAGAQAAQVRVVLDDGSELAKPGRLLFTDLSVDAASGQVSLRAEVPNAEGQLLPGQYVRVRLSQGELPAGILLPQQAVKRSNQGDSVLVVGAGNKPEPRMVKVGSAQGNQWVVLDGLKPGEQVIVDGFQKMFVPGAPVTPVPWSAAAAASAPAASAAPAAPASAASR
ncbi:efflux transporter periplasmic adaptor subunit [Paucibacter aquatile]|uniref:Efflux transporter periplasmic adaptor subunit n=1 Tax=Kinneretia aquatilis TaxID=2070761 RepID=A0A2N8KRP6_9BURK|nr:MULTISPECIES: efflux RND transporter periplasmic adaptor subunit [Roseateles]PND36113.1 efflux transporter periplasmic adaptor subunit [Paucibacter aquatile]WIV99512.1 efflux RND transporter periplasmic adaptor subunit [Paucibacter aquatile]